MSEWITDRRPTDADADCYARVWDSDGELTFYEDIAPLEPWQTTNCPGRYQPETKKHTDDDMWYIAKNIQTGLYSVHSVQRGQLCEGIANRDEARKIVAAFAELDDEEQS